MVVTFIELRKAALSIITTEGYWSPILGSDTFRADPWQGYILWHDQPQLSQSKNLCLMKLIEVTEVE